VFSKETNPTFPSGEEEATRMGKIIEDVASSEMLPKI
jgi:hypothetical protein